MSNQPDQHPDPLTEQYIRADGEIDMTRRQLDAQASHYRRRAKEYNTKRTFLFGATALAAVLAAATIPTPLNQTFPQGMTVIAFFFSIYLLKARHGHKAALLEHSAQEAESLSKRASTLSALLRKQTITPKQAKQAYRQIVHRMNTLPARTVLYPKGQDYSKIAQEEGEEAAILAGIAADSDTHETFPEETNR